MGKYQGTRWPLEGTFTQIEKPRRLAYEARSWTEDEQDTATIEHINELELSKDGGKSVVKPPHHDQRDQLGGEDGGVRHEMGLQGAAR